MFDIIPLVDAPVSHDDLSAGLLAYLRSTGMPLPEDDCLLDHLAVAVRYGRTGAVLAVQDGRAVGVSAWRTEDGIGFISILYQLPGAPEAAAYALLEHAVEGLRGWGIETGIFAELPVAPPPVDAALRDRGFVGVARHLMQVEVADPAPEITLPGGYRLTTWEPRYHDAAADVIYRANVGTVDAMVIPEIRTPEAAQRIVGQTVQGRYGRFDPEASSLILTEEGEAVGVILATRRRSGQGFTAEICVLPAYRRRGLARALMLHAHAVFCRAGIEACMLGVTDGNPARLLYETLGYRTIGAVWTYVWPAPANWPL